MVNDMSMTFPVEFAIASSTEEFVHLYTPDGNFAASALVQQALGSASHKHHEHLSSATHDFSSVCAEWQLSDWPYAPTTKHKSKTVPTFIFLNRNKIYRWYNKSKDTLFNRKIYV